MARLDSFMAKDTRGSRGPAPGEGSASVSGARNVLFLLSTLMIGGSERKIVRLANALSRRGCNVVLAYLNHPDILVREIDASVKVVHLQRRGKFSLAALRKLCDAVRDHGIDAVVSVNLYATLYAGLLAIGRRRFGRPVRFMASINATHLRGRKGRQMMLYRRALRRMDLLIFGSEFQRAVWTQQHLGLRGPKSCVLYNGVNARYFSRRRVAPVRPPGWPQERVVIGSVGMLRPEKSQEHLIQAVAELHKRRVDVGAVIVGEGAKEPELRRLAAALAVEDRVHFCGALRDVRPHMAGFDLLAVTSATETFSNAALEALAMERPVVSSRVGGMPEMLVEGGGVLYEYGDAEALVEALQPLVVSERRRAAIASQARRMVLRRFSFDAMVDAFLSLLDGHDPGGSTSQEQGGERADESRPTALRCSERP